MKNDAPETHPAALDNPSKMEDASFHMAMAHLYRAEMNRMTVWRSRLDTTSNWAILLVMGMTTFALGATQTPHFILLLGLAIIGICLIIEARRYQHLHHSKWRLQLMEQNYFGEALCPGECATSDDWRRVMSADLRQPHYTINWFLAARLRLRRNYLMLTYFVTGVWITKLLIHPENAKSASDFYVRLAVGHFLPCWFVLLSAAAFVSTSTVLAFTTPSEEALEKWTQVKHFERK